MINSSSQSRDTIHTVLLLATKDRQEHIVPNKKSFGKAVRHKKKVYITHWWRM